VSSAAARRARRPKVFWLAHGTGPSLVLINGYSASALAWPRAWTRSLERRFRLITLDNRGSGWSRFAEAPFTIGDLADDVADVLEAAEIPRATVLGLSMGGMIAQELALRRPELVTGLLLAATRPPVPSFHAPPIASAWHLVRPPGRGESLERYFRGLWTAAAAPGFAEAHPEEIEELVSQTLERPTPRTMLLHQLRAMSGWAHAERLAQLGMPTVIVHGEADTFSPPANGRALARLIPDARHVPLEGVGHLLAHEARDVLDARLEELALVEA
jgi:pimeloyl-ACP methyl ester carboxylesterase